MPASLRATRGARRAPFASKPAERSVPGPFLGEVTGVWVFLGFKLNADSETQC